VARGLRETGHTALARELLEAPGVEGIPRPEAAMERALTDLKDGLASRAVEELQPIAASSPEAQCCFAEALFFAGLSDSALSVYKQVSQDPSGPCTGAAFERMFLIEDADPRDALGAYTQMAYLHWRGDEQGTLTLADSLYRSLPHGPLWAQVAIFLGARREEAGQADEALAPLMAVAEGLPGDRLAPLARQRAGDLYLYRLKDPAKALEQYEECLERYPRAWNAAEVRRQVEALRKGRL
jgi:tetratricopeptide (TPR) repeat protein